MPFGLSHHTEPVTLGTFHGHSLTATVDRYELRLRAFGIHVHWCVLRPRAVDAGSGVGVQRADLRARTLRAMLGTMRRVVASLGR
jgi:hypothetical protein